MNREKGEEFRIFCGPGHLDGGNWGIHILVGWTCSHKFARLIGQNREILH